MTIRPIRRLWTKAILGGGTLTGLFLGWCAAEPLIAQYQPNPPSPAQPSAVSAQTSQVRRVYLKKNVIELPVVIEDAQISRIQEIHLYMKDNPASQWLLADKVAPSQGKFTVQLPKDGEYWFTMVTVDKQGRSFPADVRNEPPGMAVVIDSTPPVIELTNLGETPMGQLVQCEIRDPHLDIGKTRVVFQSGDKVFREMPAVPGRNNVYCIPAEAVTTGVVRVMAEDLAKNEAFVEEHLSKMRSMKPAVERVDTGGLPMPGPLPKNLVGGQSVTPPTGPNFAAVEPIERTTHVRPNGNEGPRLRGVHDFKDPTPPQHASLAPSQQTVKSSAAPDNVKKQIVNTTKVFLDYQIENAGPSGVGKVEVWITRDRGQSWHKIAEEMQRKSPIEVQLPGEGLFGITLTASNGRGVVGTPPTTGDSPDGWIEVITSKPFAQITSVRSAVEDGKAVVHISWNAHAKHLSETPVDLYYAATPQGPWLPIAKGLKAEGTHRWAPPASIGAQAHLRLTAQDVAGNVGIATTLEPVHFEDPARPVARIRAITTSAPATSGPVSPSPSLPPALPTVPVLPPNQ